MYLGNAAAAHPDKPAVIVATTGETRRYAELDARSNRLAHLLRAHGVGPGDHIAMFLDNCLSFFDVVQAGLRAGLYVTPINHHLSAAAAAYIVDNCDAKVLIAGAALADSVAVGRLATRCTVKLSVGGAIEGYEDFDDAIARYPATPVADERLGSLMFYSSGTTGHPKGVRRPLLDRPASAGNPAMKASSDMYGIDADTVYLSPAPLYHGAPGGFTAGVIQAGGTVVMMERFDAEQALAAIERWHVTHSQWVPTMFVRLLRLDPATRTRHDLSSHRCAIHAAAPCPQDVKRAMIDWWGPILDEFYTSTERVGFARITSEEWLAHPGSVGRPQPGAIHVCDEDGNDVGPGEPGLIYGVVPDGGVFAYHKDGGKTAGAVHPQHADWMTVGDVGYLDSDGYLYLTDRKAFMIISGGVNIYPQQIEDVLTMHPKVGDVAVLGVPNAELGEEVKAVVEPGPGVAPSEALAQEIIDFVRDRLGRQLAPRSVDFVDFLPRLPTGKLHKKELRDRYWQHAGTGATD